MTSPIKAEDTRSKLLQTSLELLWTNSYGTVSVDDICKKAGVRKGSFYHFFPSKSDLTVSAFEEQWAEKKPFYDRVFSPSVAPLERFRMLCREAVEQQKKMKEDFGYICGCPYATIGSELCSCDELVRKKAAEVIQRTLQYYEGAIHEAISRGEMDPCDAARKAREVYNYMIGCMTQARITNDLTVLDDLEPGMLALLAG